MSQKKIPTPVEFTVCDLCGEKIEQVSEHGERVNLIYRRSPIPVEGVKPKWFRLSTSTRKPEDKFGRRYAEYIDWDFHAECLVDALKPIIKKEDADGGEHQDEA